MSTTTRAFIALVASLTLLTTGCGSDGSADVATAGGDSSEATSEESSRGTTGLEPGDDGFDEQMLAYAQCLRENGVDVDDPEPGKGLALSAESAEEQHLIDDAMKKCEDLAPARPADDADQEVRQQMLDFAACMREEGVESFEDPKPGEGINIEPEMAEDPDFEAAEKICNEKIMGGQPDTEGGQS